MFTRIKTLGDQFVQVVLPNQGVMTLADLHELAAEIQAFSKMQPVSAHLSQHQGLCAQLDRDPA